jgi:hypothetical protein
VAREVGVAALAGEHEVVGRTEVGMRKQYYFRPSSRGLLAWDVDRLVRLSSALQRKRIQLAGIRELDEEWHCDADRPTWRDVIEHVGLIQAADLSFPIILSETGSVMDGMHRVAKAVLCGGTETTGVQFDEDPEPDHVGFGPEELPY